MTKNAMFNLRDYTTADILNTPVRRGGILPVTEYPNRTEFDLSSGLTGALMDAFTAPARAARGEISEAEQIPEAFNFAGSLTLGSLLAPRPTGSVGMGGRAAKEALDMSEAARMARAKEMGFDKSRVWYRGDDAEIKAFETHRPSKRWTTFSEHDVVTQGVNFSPSAEDAKSYGQLVREYYLRPGNMLKDPTQIALSSRSPATDRAAAAKAWDDVEYILAPEIREIGDGRKVIDTDGGIGTIDVDPDGEWITKAFRNGYMDWSYLDNPEVVSRMRERGYDSAMVAEPNDVSGESIFIIDPSNIRSVNAAFDPAKSSSANILAANAKTGAAVPLATKALEAQQPQGIRAFHGSPHNYKAERLIEWPDGRTEYIEGMPDVLPDVPQGARVIKDFPLGRQRLDKIGTGEGAQAYAYGLYEAGAEGTAQTYKTALAGKALDPKDLAARHDLPEAVSADLFNAIHHGKDDPLEAAKAVQMKNPALRDDGPITNVGPKRRQIAQAIEDGRNLAKGHMYEVRINADPNDFLDWDKPLSQQSEKVRNAVLGSGMAKTPFGSLDTVKRLLAKERGRLAETQQEIASNRGMFGRSKMSKDERAYYERIADESTARIDEFERILAGDATASYLVPQGGDTAAQFSSAMRDAGIPGIRYLDQMSRGEGKGSSNYVVFDDALIEVLRKYGILPPVAAGGLAAALGQEDDLY